MYSVFNYWSFNRTTFLYDAKQTEIKYIQFQWNSQMHKTCRETWQKKINKYMQKQLRKLFELSPKLRFAIDEFLFMQNCSLPISDYNWMPVFSIWCFYAKKSHSVAVIVFFFFLLQLFFFLSCIFCSYAHKYKQFCVCIVLYDWLCSWYETDLRL